MTIEKNVPGVGIIIINNDKFLLQLRDDKPDIPNPNAWGLVGGAIENSESPEEAIRRECKEEIGVVPKDLRYIGYANDGKFRFLAYLSDDEACGLVLGEGQKIKFFLPEEILNLKVTPRVERLFKEYSNAVKKLINKQEVDAEELGLEK